MHITRLKLSFFRNILDAELEFAPQNNLICGPNGAGKTNILEALFYLGVARSFRTNLDDNMVNTDSEFFRLEADGRIPPHEVNMEIAVKPGKRKTIKVNSSPLKRLGQLFEYFRLVEFSPYDIEIINGAPANRRKFLSLTIAQSEPQHISVLTEYYKILAQRNALLKSYQAERQLSSAQEATLEAWDERLAQTAVIIHNARRRFVNEIAELAAGFYRRISGPSESLSMEYDFSPKIEEYSQANLCAKWASRRQRELSMAQTLYGPHRDDLKFIINGLEARPSGSQGQVKTAVLGLKLAQYEYLKKCLGQTPIMLLDEIFSDFDTNRLEYIIRLLPQLGQTFITTSKLSEIRDLRIFDCKYQIEKGIPSHMK